MTDAIPVLRDIVLEAQTTSRDLEYDDPVVDNLTYIENLAKRAIELLGGEV